MEKLYRTEKDFLGEKEIEPMLIFKTISPSNRARYWFNCALILASNAILISVK